MTTVEIAIEARAAVGEAPFWDDTDGTLLWVDILGGQVHRSDPSTGRMTHTYEIGQEVGSAVPRRAGGYLLAVRDGVMTLAPEQEQTTLLADIEGDDPGNRMNDAKCDPAGRFWAGTCAFDLRSGAGSLYRVGHDGYPVRVLTGVTLSNGMGWSPDHTLMYYTDSTTQRVDALDYDQDSGEVRNRRPLIRVPAALGMPDGLTVDADGGIWVALWTGGAVHRYHPNGTLDQVIELPVRNVTCCAFGGPDHRDLYITTASAGLDETELRRQPHAGSVFVTRPGPAGLPAHRAAA